MLALQQSHLPESAEILDLLNKIEFEGLFYSHDKLASLQGGLPWKKCLAEMWSKAGIVMGSPNLPKYSWFYPTKSALLNI